MQAGGTHTFGLTLRHFTGILNYRPTFDNKGISCEKADPWPQKNVAFPGAKRPPPWRRDALGVVARDLLGRKRAFVRPDAFVLQMEGTKTQINHEVTFGCHGAAGDRAVAGSLVSTLLEQPAAGPPVRPAGGSQWPAGQHYLGSWLSSFLPSLCPSVPLLL